MASTSYSIQVGVFASEENAARLTDDLKAKGLPATYGADASKYFKVHVGTFPNRTEAEHEARALRSRGAFDEFYVVALNPAVAAGRIGGGGVSESELAADPSAALRLGLVETSRSFLAYPYTWGGTTAEEGFDCSGLVMAVYRLNGLDLPRSIWDQMRFGYEVSRSSLRPGDLIFFATQAPGIPSHVGLYIGGGLFIHAPRRGTVVREESLAGPYFSARFLSARRYF